MLFTGHSGKNRLLAAQLFAHELSVDLFQIDLERIVSKYVGDTEKNLDALFKAAEASDAVLLFDDTDHLFGGRSGDDSGRFANLDVAQLRQRIESYDGVVVICADDRASTSIPKHHAPVRRGRRTHRRLNGDIPDLLAKGDAAGMDG